MGLSNEHAALVIRAFKGTTQNPNQCFTCYDITKAARSLTDDNIRHFEVRELVHALYDQGLLQPYNRVDHTFWDPDGTEYVTAKLFVPPGADCFAYDPTEIKLEKDKTEDENDEEPDILLEDGDGKALISVGKKTENTEPKTENSNVAAAVDGMDDESIKIHTNDSIFDIIKRQVKTKLNKWW